MVNKSKKAMELEIKNLQKHMGGLVKTILDLKSKVEALEKKDEKNQEGGIQDIFERQKDIEKAIAANTDAILKIDKEILNLSQPKRNDLEILTDNKTKMTRS